MPSPAAVEQLCIISAQSPSLPAGALETDTERVSPPRRAHVKVSPNPVCSLNLDHRAHTEAGTFPSPTRATAPGSAQQGVSTTAASCLGKLCRTFPSQHSGTAELDPWLRHPHTCHLLTVPTVGLSVAPAQTSRPRVGSGSALISGIRRNLRLSNCENPPRSPRDTSLRCGTA